MFANPPMQSLFPAFANETPPFSYEVLPPPVRKMGLFSRVRFKIFRCLNTKVWECGCGGSESPEITLARAVRNRDQQQQVREAMLYVPSFVDPVLGIMEQAKVNDGIVMENTSDHVVEAVPQLMSGVEPCSRADRLKLVAAMEAVGSDEAIAAAVADMVDEPVRVLNVCHNAIKIPRFAAACCVVLRAKLGIMTRMRANELVLQREYLKLCRDRNVRSQYVDMHWFLVRDQYFGTDLDSANRNAHKRLPRWVCALLDIQDAPPELDTF